MFFESFWLGSALLCTTNDNQSFDFCNMFESKYLEDGDIVYYLCCYANAIAFMAHCKYIVLG